MSDFIHLTNKTEYSLSEGALPISRIAELCQSFEMPAVGISDSNNMFGALEFSTQISNAGIQPIIGCNVKIKTPSEYMHESIKDLFFEVNLYSKNNFGYQNLLKLISMAYTKNKKNSYIELNDLFNLKDGIIVLTGGKNSILKQCKNKIITNQANNFIKILKDNFNDDLYVEIQRLGKTFEILDEFSLLSLAYDNSLPLVATNDVLYESPEYYEAHDALSCIEKKLYVSQTDRPRLSDQHYFKSQNEMKELFIDLPEALYNTVEIAKKCSFKPDIQKPVLPVFPISNQSEKDLITKLSNEGLELRLKEKFLFDEDSLLNEEEIKSIYQARLNKELDIIIDMKYEGYFLIVSDFIKWSKDNGIPVGPGRGSGAGSLVAWVLNITDLDPIKFGLIFERFLNPERVSLPDFDIDFCRDGRDKVLDYVHKKYGKDKVAQIITFGKLQARAVIRDVGRVLGMPYGQVDGLCKLMPFDPSRPMSLQGYINEEPKLNEYADNDPKVRKLLDISLKLEGLKRHASIHAAGVVISKDKIFNDVPLYSDPESEIFMTQFDMKWVENAGLVKFDFLGLKTLTLINNCLELINKENHVLDINKIDLKDNDTFNLLGTGETTGIFQLESAGMKETLKQLKPDKFEDIIAIVALYRPGPMANIPTYIERKHGRERPDYIHPLLKDLLEETYGVVIYQEQVMGIARELSGYTDGEADLLRRAMGKKIQKEMNAQRKRFIEGCLNKNLKDQEAHNIFDLLSKFADYGFNKSHAAAYALIAFQTAYLKTHYPIEFFAASMTLDINNTDKLSIFQQELDRLNIKLLPPNINSSDSVFTRHNDSISYALGAIKNVGTEAMKDLVDERENKGEFKNFDDFISRVGISVANKKTLEALACVGAFDDFNIDRSQIFKQSVDIVKHLKSMSDKNLSNQSDMFGSDLSTHFKFLDNEKWSKSYSLMKEFEMLGFYLTGHPLNQYEEKYDDLNLKYFENIKSNKNLHNSKGMLVAGTLLSKKEKRSARGNAYAFLNFSDTSSIYELIIFETNLRKYRELLIEGESYVLGVDFTSDNNSLRGELKKVFSFDQVLKFNKKNDNKFKKDIERQGSTLKIYVNNDFAKDKLSELKLISGYHKVEIIINNQIVKVPGDFEVNKELIASIKNMNGVEKVLFNENTH
mgnify:FL=1